ncbi:hypothetical protein M3Y98_00875400 [Aphelenchoides besseyi]|nr:hypothetical protein M3Y98_00875400 [Aphelenchoides besseyi]KAI6195000.1 hypothetical protein M3Y96_01184700 [Aphelenchoides besseyi]
MTVHVTNQKLFVCYLLAMAWLEGTTSLMQLEQSNLTVLNHTIDFSTPTFNSYSLHQRSNAIETSLAKKIPLQSLGLISSTSNGKTDQKFTSKLSRQKRQFLGGGCCSPFGAMSPVCCPVPLPVPMPVPLPLPLPIPIPQPMPIGQSCCACCMPLCLPNCLPRCGLGFGGLGMGLGGMGLGGMGLGGMGLGGFSGLGMGGCSPFGFAMGFRKSRAKNLL